MLQKIHIEKFKSFVSAELPLAPLTLLVGANASGKSNALEAVRLLGSLASGRRLDDLLTHVQSGDQWIRGRAEDLTWPGEDRFTLGCTSDDEPWSRFSIAIAVGESGLRIVDESLAGHERPVPLYAVVEPAAEPTHDVQVSYDNFARGGDKPRILCHDHQAIFTQLGTPARFGAGHREAQEKIPAAVERLRHLLESILFLDPSPRRMRGYAFKNDRRLREDGENLSSVLFDLCHRKGRKEEVLAFVRELPEREIRDIQFVETERGEVMLRLAEGFGLGKLSWDAPSLSDGTLRVLAVAAAMMSADEGSLVVIEEIDNGVHPSRAAGLLEQIERLAEERSLRVVLTTHNPALLDALPSAAVPHVVFCHRDHETGESRLTPLESLADYVELVGRGPLGEMLTAGVVDRYVRRARGEGERRRQSEAWLENFEQELAHG